MDTLLKDTQSKLSEVELQRQKDALERDKLAQLEQQVKQSGLLHGDTVKQLEMRIKQLEFKANINESRLKEEQVKVQDGREKLVKFAQITKKLQGDLVKAHGDLYNMNGILEAFQGAAQEIKGLKLRIEGLNGELERCREGDLMGKELVEGMKKEMKLSEQAKVNAEMELKRAQQEIATLQLIQNQLKQEIKDKNFELLYKEQALASLKKEKDEEIEQILSSSRSEFATLQDNLTNTYNDLTIVTSQLNKVRLNEKNLLTENAKLRDQNMNNTNEMDLLQTNNDLLSEKIEILQSTIFRLNEEIQKLKSQSAKTQKPVLFLTEKDENIPQSERKSSQPTKSLEKKKKEVTKAKTPRTSSDARSQRTSRSSTTTSKAASTRSSPLKKKKRPAPDLPQEELLDPPPAKHAPRHISRRPTRTKTEKTRKAAPEEDSKAHESEVDSLLDLSRRLEESRTTSSHDKPAPGWESGYLDALINEFSQFNVPSVSTSSLNLALLEGLSDFSE
uniref:Uncharacterized protein n=1 Tax=Arcella intermedia TaxID=1963864 RepID=A0A6B2L0X8_9EUKA